MIQGRLTFLLVIVFLFAAAIPLSPSAEAGSWGSGGYRRGGIGFGYSGHVRGYRSGRYWGGYGYGRRGIYPRRYGYFGSRYCPTYRYRRGYYSRSNRFYRPYAYSLPANVSNYTVYGAHPGKNAWHLLAGGQIPAAQQMFALKAESSPSSSIPKLGYALAAALAGDYDRAEWAMRRAFKADPTSLDTVRIEPALAERLSSVESYYKDSLYSKASNPNAAFMLAALNYIHQEHEPASDYIELAIESGDLEASTFNLKKQLYGPEGS